VDLDEHVLHDVIHVFRVAGQLEHEGAHVGGVAAKHLVEAER
jgi:hypothetical protein